MKKTIILAMPDLFKIHETIAENLRFHGFNTIVIAYKEEKYRYTGLLDKLKKIYHRNLLNDKNYKKELIFKQHGQPYLNLLNTIQEPVDYCLFIWPFIFPHSFMKILREKAKLCVHYNWESLAFFANDIDKLKYFDKFFYFDPYDTGKWQQNNYPVPLLPTTSFYFDFPLPACKSKNSLFFLGLHAKQRIADIQAFYEIAKQVDLEVDFRIVAHDIQQAKEELKLEEIQYLPFSEALSYYDNLLLSAQAHVLVDFLNRKHHGLSLRVFEALGLSKKLITTNPTVIHYDFYHPNNIFIWNGNNHHELRQFLTQPYHPLPTHIMQKYSFGNWIKYILDIEPHQKITLPQLP